MFWQMVEKALIALMVAFGVSLTAAGFIESLAKKIVANTALILRDLC